MFRFDTIRTISTTTNLVLLVHKEFEDVAEIAWGYIVMGHGTVGVIEVHYHVPVAMRHENDIAWIHSAFQRATRLVGNIEPFHMFRPMLQQPFSDRKRNSDFISVLTGENTWRRASGWIENPSLSAQDAGIPGMSCIGVNVKDRS